MSKRHKTPYMRFVATQKHTPQSEPMPGTEQVPNSAGGYSFAVDKWTRLDRFLILGTDGGSYYATEQQLTVENATHLTELLASDGVAVVDRIVEISASGRAPRNTPAIFALALASAAEDETVRQHALAAIPAVCRTATHLFEYVELVKSLRGWGRALRRGIANWYTDKDAEAVAYQVTKYRQRNGWTHKDVLRVAHPKPTNGTHDALFRWVTKDEKPAWATQPSAPDNKALERVWAFERAQQAQEVRTVVHLIEEYDLVREAIPTGFLNDAAVWEALLRKMPMTALIRNLGNMSKVGLLTPLSEAERVVVERLSDAERLRKARVHPIALLSALRVYTSGQGAKGSGRWTPTTNVVEALDNAFTLSFDVVAPTNKRTLVALDVSGSMSWGEIARVPKLSPRMASAAMAMVTARTESRYHFTAFSHEMVPVNIHGRMSLDDVVQTVHRIPMGGTDCALPMVYARENKLEVDTFVIYTDSETWYGNVHPVQALRDYRQASGIDAKLIVVGMLANNFSIADPNDNGMLDVVGFDSAAPNLMNAFARGEV
jgi:60 kDa SS-A/Ro ribonucleoprotein